MKLFDSSPQSKAMQSLIHDTRNLGDTIRWHGKKLRECLKEQDIKDSSPWVHIEYITSKIKEVEKAIDIYYECFSNDFPDSLPPGFKPEIPTAFNLAEQLMPECDWKGNKMELYRAFERLIERYTLIRKANADATSLPQQAG